MQQKNFYEILGVKESATQDEIKDAYKKLSRQYHPDLPHNKNNKQSEQKFAELSEANQVLSDPQQRRTYDFSRQTGGGFGGGGGGFGGFEGFDFGGFGGFDEDIFSNIFGGGPRRRDTGQAANSRIQGADVSASISITLVEAYEGKQISIEYYRNDKCDTCHASGIKDSSKHKCNQCGGVGYISINAILTVIRQTCPKCNGSKYVSDPCSSCNGKRRRRHKVVETINIPCGIDDGQSLIVPNKGDAGIAAPNGNLIIKIKVKEDPVFKRDKGDLFVTYNVPLSTMVLGGSIEVSSIVGPKFKVEVPRGSQSDTRVRVSGKGMRYQNSESRGSLNVILVPIIPNPDNFNEKVAEAWKTIQEEKEPVTQGSHDKRHWSWIFF